MFDQINIKHKDMKLQKIQLNQTDEHLKYE